MDTEAVTVFVTAAAAGSLSAAARRLAITPMTATRRLAGLERVLGLRLMQRTTRAVSLTPEGEAFLPYAQAMVESEAAGRAMLRSAAIGVSGLLRVTTPAAFGRKIIAPLIPGLLRAHPELRIDLDLNDAVVDIVATGADLAIRIAVLRDSALIAHKVAASPRVLCAAPAYLAERGTPRLLADLAGHDCLTQTGTTHWPFQADRRDLKARVNGRFSANGIEALHGACLGGAGIALLALWNVGDDLAAGRLVRITLEDAAALDLSIWAVYPSARFVLPKLRVFIQALEGALRPAA
ncbi:LysR family transcriptional regulator [Rhodospirillum rubrum]|uniref:Transcriptional regulator, LysR family n=1 Tax=Rhodospirillum rubrum (strain ATCC 11170 / ATH 1.1.1 / DSM 467 / LMG 4362 / NCIMB 8255 / S1) TaxID=269796 RepID=Q2RNM5_RHORT|nr:LysR family transcriptional regulator [Rhodospirillum rubrum]ABC24270.1 transcriptional regulator, LysR family [Rhodospirillum rubrum ATCC 11170]AEO50021.1 LysR family transcriptional regulator [Rhodospirillum rubrum F11]MBK5955989.1 LysR family transcriptional regulator [Rhodospirillum rubrum]QXG80199.1 LysR family transcriptional regulator [Rhodospirillum rubrum]HCF19216.1 LysR family transcriptional regulator [Rhodospirillum rubrum]